jgi:hypothetical protein
MLRDIFAPSISYAFDECCTSKNVPCATSSNWKSVLEPVVQDPDQHISNRYGILLRVLLFDLRRSAVSFSCCWFDDRVAVVYDGFPKVQTHLLIITCSSSASLPWLLLREQARIHLLIVARDISGTIPTLMNLCATAATYHAHLLSPP